MADTRCQDLAEFGRELGEVTGDDRLLTALASGCHIGNAAATAGISERTAYRRLADPEFRAKLNEARESLRESILARLADAGHDAIGTLWEMMQSSEDENVRLKAAKTLLDSLMRSHSTMSSPSAGRAAAKSNKGTHAGAVVIHLPDNGRDELPASILTSNEPLSESTSVDETADLLPSD